jgi:hypothetical protein
MRVTNGILLGSSLLLPVDTVNCVQTLKANLGRGLKPKEIGAVNSGAAESLGSVWSFLTEGTALCVVR